MGDNFYTLPNEEVVFGLTNESKRIADMIITSSGQADLFVFSFLVNSKNSNMALGDYREHRIIDKNVTFKAFSNNYQKNERKGLEDLFLHPIKKFHIEKLTLQINNGIITLEKLHTRHKRQPRAKILRLLL